MGTMWEWGHEIFSGIMCPVIWNIALFLMHKGTHTKLVKSGVTLQTLKQ